MFVQHYRQKVCVKCVTEQKIDIFSFLSLSSHPLFSYSIFMTTAVRVIANEVALLPPSGLA